MRPILFALALAVSFLSSPAGLGVSWLVSSGASINKAGCGADPYGLHSPSAQAVPLDEGCGADPDGRCTASTVPPFPSDAGCGMDPDGCP